jgi:oligoribonuclease
MIYVSIDIETSGLEPLNNSVLSFGAIIEDTTNKLPYEKLPKFNAIVLQNQITGSPRAISMNKEIISLIGEYKEGNEEDRANLEHHSDYVFLEENELAQKFYDFLFLNGIYPNSSFLNNHVRNVNGTMIPAFNNHTPSLTINVAGKNFGTFDKLFLEELPWWKKLIKIRQRIIDPSVLYCIWDEDNAIPSLKKCKERAGIDGEVAHTALEDAWDVVQMLRKFY